MEEYPFQMDRFEFVMLNGPLSLCCTVVNLFCIFCIFSPKRAAAIKQPLRILLASVVMCSAILQTLFLQYIVMIFQFSLSTPHKIVQTVLKELVEISMTTTVWLNVFYFSQIVPAQRAFFIWLKTNIKLFIYCALVFEWVFFSCNGILMIVLISLEWPQNTINSTGMYNDTDPQENSVLLDISVISYVTELLHLFMSLAVMMTSSCATVSYLKCHMKNMKSSRLSSSLQSQVRVTTTGIVQTLLYFLCAIWIFINMLADVTYKNTFDRESHIFYTFVSLYSLGTSVNLCIGQSLFRQRAIELWHKVLQHIHSRRHA